MAIHNTPEFLGQRPVPAVRESGELVEVLITVSPSVVGAAIGSTDTVNLMYIPANAVLSSIRIQADATTTAKPQVGIAANAASTSLTTKYTAATDVVQTTAVTTANVGIFQDAASATNARILALVNTTAALTETLYVAVAYRAAR